MQEKKNIRLLISLVLLIGVAMLLFLFGGSQENSVNRSLFKITELASVDKIELLTKDRKVTLTFDGSRWIVDAKNDADDRLITVLFATLDQVEVKRPVAQKIAESVSSRIETQGVEVRLFVEEKLVRAFNVGGNDSKTESYIMDAENGPYVMAIPGYRVYAAGVFEVDAVGWRDKRIFNFSWRNFKGLECTLTSNTEESFMVGISENGFDIIDATFKTDTTKLNDYLDAVSLLTANQLLAPGTNDLYDSLTKSPPSVSIKVFDVGNNIYSLDIYEPLPGDPNVVSKTGDGVLSIFTRQQVSPVLKNRSYFRAPKP